MTRARSCGVVRAPRPLVEGAARRGDGALEIGAVAFGALRDDLLGRRVDDVERAAAAHPHHLPSM